MKINIEIKTTIKYSVVVLTLLILLPTSIQLFHAFEKHEQSICNELTTHIHVQEIDCSICDFKISTYNYSFTNLLEHYIVKHNLEYADYYKSKKHNSIKPIFSLRGPPLFS